MSARSTSPSSMTIGTSHSTRMPSRSSPRAAAIATNSSSARDLSPGAASVSTRFHARTAVHERGNGAEDQHQYAVEDDLLHHRRARHRLHNVIDEVARQGRQQDDGHAVANSLAEPGL